MYFLYLDESGNTSLDKGTTYYVLLGVAILDKNTKDISEQVKELIRYIELELSNGWRKVDSSHPFSRAIKESSEEYLKVKPLELHYHDLIQGKPPYDVFDKPKRKEIADRMFEILVNNDVTLFASVINKRLHAKKYVLPIGPDLLGLEFIVGRFEHFLERQQDYGIIVLDEKGRKENLKIRNFFQDLREEGTGFKKLDKVIESIFLTPSEYTYSIQLADFAAYAVFSKFEHEKENRFREIEGKFDKIDGNLVGIKVWEPRKPTVL